jgi:hypothetical protein
MNYRKISGLRCFRIVVSVPELVKSLAAVRAEPLGSMVRRVHSQAFLRKCMDGHRIFIHDHLIFMIWLLGDLARLLGIAHEEEHLAVLESAIVHQLR